MCPMLITFAALTVSAPSQLEAGIERYEAGDYQGALVALTAALDEAPRGRTRARIHCYVGLIQVRYGLEKDATGSFRAALDQHASVRLPDTRVATARRIFRRLKKERRARKAEPSEKKKRQRRRRRARATKRGPKPVPPAAKDSTAAGAQRTTAESQPKLQRSLPERRVLAEGAGSVAPRPSAVTPSPPPAVARPTPPPSEPALVVDQPDPDPEPGPNTAAWSLVGVGGAAIIAGGVLEGFAIANQRAAAEATQASRAAELTDTFQTQEQAAWITFGVGVAITTAAIIWLAVDD